MKNFSKVKLKKYGFVWTIMAYPMLLFIVFYLVCNFGSLVMAFQKRDFLGNVTGWVGFANFTKFVKDIAETELMSTALKNTCLMYGTDLLIVLPLQLLFSYYLFRKIPGHKAIRFIVMLPSIISGFVVCLVFKKFVEGALPSMMKNLFGLKTFPNLISEVKYTFKTVLFYNVWMSFTTALVMYSNAMNKFRTRFWKAVKSTAWKGACRKCFILFCHDFPDDYYLPHYGIQRVFVDERTSGGFLQVQCAAIFLYAGVLFLHTGGRLLQPDHVPVSCGGRIDYDDYHGSFDLPFEIRAGKIRTQHRVLR